MKLCIKKSGHYVHYDCLLVIPSAYALREICNVPGMICCLNFSLLQLKEHQTMKTRKPKVFSPLTRRFIETEKGKGERNPRPRKTFILATRHHAYTSKGLTPGILPMIFLCCRTTLISFTMKIVNKH